MRTGDGRGEGPEVRDGRGTRRWALAGVALLVGVGIGGCDGPFSAEGDGERLLAVTAREGLIFMSQNRRPSAAMDALFDGPVIADEAGCLRLGSGDGATVVWPAGHDVDGSGDVPRIEDDEGAVVGVVGGAFTLAGGEVAELPATMGFTDEDRERSEVCPGGYWIVDGQG